MYWLMTTFWCGALAGASAGGILLWFGLGWWSLAGFIPAALSGLLGTAYRRPPIGRNERVVHFVGGQIAAVYGLTLTPEETARQQAADAMSSGAKKEEEQRRSARAKGLDDTDILWTFDTLERYELTDREVTVPVGPFLTKEELYDVPGGQRLAASVLMSPTTRAYWLWNAAWIWEIAERFGSSAAAVAWLEEALKNALVPAARMALSQQSWVTIISEPEQLATDLLAALRGPGTLLCREGILAETPAQAAQDWILLRIVVEPGEIPAEILEDLTELRKTVAKCDRRMQELGVDSEEKRRECEHAVALKRDEQELALASGDRVHERAVAFEELRARIDREAADQESQLAREEHALGLHRGRGGRGQRRRRGRGGHGGGQHGGGGRDPS